MTSTDTPTFAAGVYDMPEDVYLSDPVPGGSLSASGAKKLLACPARFEHDRHSPPEPTAAMELGSAVHRMVLGAGPELVIIDAENYRTAKAREARDGAKAAGSIPLLPAEYEQVKAMAHAVTEHPLAGPLFSGGKPEQSLFWKDPDWGIWCRARLDWLPHGDRPRFIVPDLKSCTSASPAAIAKAVANYGYHISAAWYLDGVRALGLAQDPAFLLVFIETAEPYLITVAELDAEALAAGHRAGQEARERFRDCSAVDIWPAYTDDVALISLPRWAQPREDYL